MYLQMCSFCAFPTLNISCGGSVSMALGAAMASTTTSAAPSSFIQPGMFRRRAFSADVATSEVMKERGGPAHLQYNALPTRRCAGTSRVPHDHRNSTASLAWRGRPVSMNEQLISSSHSRPMIAAIFRRAAPVARAATSWRRAGVISARAMISKEDQTPSSGHVCTLPSNCCVVLC